MSCVVTLPYDPVWQALDWAKKHCPSYITNFTRHESYYSEIGYDTYDHFKIDYYFGDSREAALFILRWT